MSLSSTKEIIAELRAGRMVILVDEEDRENEGDLVLAAEFNLVSAVSTVNRSLSLSIAPFMLSAVQAYHKYCDEWVCFGKGNLNLKNYC